MPNTAAKTPADNRARSDLAHSPDFVEDSDRTLTPGSEDGRRVSEQTYWQEYYFASDIQYEPRRPSPACVPGSTTRSATDSRPRPALGPPAFQPAMTLPTRREALLRDAVSQALLAGLVARAPCPLGLLAQQAIARPYSFCAQDVADGAGLSGTKLAVPRGRKVARHCHTPAGRPPRAAAGRASRGFRRSPDRTASNAGSRRYPPPPARGRPAP